jgi:hypothetical protein
MHVSIHIYRIFTLKYVCQHTLHALGHSYDRREFGAYFEYEGSELKESSQLSELLKDLSGKIKPTNLLILHKFDFLAANDKYMEAFHKFVQKITSIGDHSVKVVICSSDSSKFKFKVYLTINVCRVY